MQYLYNNNIKVMICLYSNNNKYFRYCVHLILSQNGCVPDHIKFDLLWNRTVNVKGLKGKNIEMDHLCEYVVKECKEQIRALSGDPSLEALQRRTEMFYVACILKRKMNDITGNSLFKLSLFKSTLCL